MAQKKQKAIKTDVGTAKKEVVTPPSKPNPAISTLEQATSLVKGSYKKALVLEYLVLENGVVFYGKDRSTALKYSNRFGLKYFDVKLKT